MVSEPTATSSPPERPSDGIADLLGRMHVEVFGPEDAPPVLLLHGWGSSAELMRAAGQPLAASHRVHNLDLPGHGRTPPPPEAWGVPEYAALVAHYVRAHGLAPLPAIGHSNGGRILLHLASDDATANLFSRLVLISPSGVRPPRPLSYYLKTAWASVLKAPFRLLPEGPLRRRGLAWLRTTIFWKLIASTDYRSASGVMRETFVRTVTHHLDDRLGRVHVPTLVLWGENDTAVSRQQMETLARAIPDAGLVILEHAGHYGYLDAYDTYAAAVQHFLNDEA